jgi:outer membrane protein OmpA-like peptidoglycan-associated protein
VGNKLVGFILAFVITGYSYAQEFQTVDSKHCDCENAMYTEDAFFEPMNMPKGYGKKLEIKGNSIKNKYVPTKEHNALWVKFKFEMDTDFEFQLSPSISTDDFDFVLWKVNGSTYCDSIAKGLRPVRSNLARRNPDDGSVTGLKKGAGQDYAKAGPNPTFSNSIAVKKGEEYILLIDAPYGAQGGFTTEFEFERFVAPIEVPIEDLIVEVKDDLPKLYIRVNDESNAHLFSANINIKGLLDQDSVYEQNGYFVISQMRQFTNYTIDVNKRDYLQTTEKYFAKEVKNDTLIVQLKKLRIGSKLEFHNILFVPDQHTIMKSSNLDLKRIRNFLKTNPQIDVEIMGHVNGLAKKKKRYRELSERRAKAIYEYLVEQGIDKNRMAYEGYGNEKLIYAHPKNETEARLNRRVEVKITKI